MGAYLFRAHIRSRAHTKHTSLSGTVGCREIGILSVFTLVTHSHLSRV
ncbi:hypothetical protein [Pseudomonas phage vB_Pae_HMKU_23]|nr:hypothetical protein [Pseudomonas phage vB_Pae_HMKU_23]